MKYCPVGVGSSGAPMPAGKSRTALPSRYTTRCIGGQVDHDRVRRVAQRDVALLHPGRRAVRTLRQAHLEPAGLRGDDRQHRGVAEEGRRAPSCPTRRPGDAYPGMARASRRRAWSPAAGWPRPGRRPARAGSGPRRGRGRTMRCRRRGGDRRRPGQLPAVDGHGDRDRRQPDERERAHNPMETRTTPDGGQSYRPVPGPVGPGVRGCTHGRSPTCFLGLTLRADHRLQPGRAGRGPGARLGDRAGRPRRRRPEGAGAQARRCFEIIEAALARRAHASTTSCAPGCT